jgi:hypothetical protein
MVETNTITPLKLPDEVRKQLESLDTNIATAEQGIETLKKLGQDVSQLEGQIKWAKEVRTTLLQNFS